jgi:putative DNA primase/helicase
MNKLTEALTNANIPVPSKDTETFKIVRWGRNNRYWLKKFDGGYVFGDFVTGLNDHVFERNLKGERLKNAQNCMLKAYAHVKPLSIPINEHAASVAQNILTYSQQCATNHEYLAQKHVLAHGLKEHKGAIVIPAYDINGKLWTLQFIDTEGKKRFLSGGKKRGCFFPIGSLDNAERVFICEGYATGATVYETINEPVVVAFDSGNLKPVAQALREKYSNIKIIICADNDCYHETGINPGLEKAKEAALDTKAIVIYPAFKDSSTHPTDFNDLLILEGRETVKEQLDVAIEKSNDSGIPDGFVLSDEGLFCLDKKQSTTKISNYIKVIAFTKNNDEVSRLVEFKDYKNNLQRILIKPKMFTKDGDQIRVQLISKGFVYAGTSLSKRKLFEYISSSVPNRELVLASRTGFLNDVYIRPDQVVGESEDEIILDTAVNDESYGTSGTLEQWNELVARWCVGNSRLIFAICTAFASVLLRICNVQNFGFHIVGNSSSGKTTCLKVAASVFGNSKFVVSWKATDNAMENIAFRRNDSLLILDEISEISPSKAGDVAYMLANGQGKKRLDKNCNARETYSWTLIFLSSGEVDLSSHMAEDSKTSKAGQKVRLLNIPAKASKDSCGIFENLMGFQDGAEFSDYLRENTSKYYGIASVEFIKHVLNHQSDIRDSYKEEFFRLKSLYLPKNAEGQDMRAFERFMLVGFAGELAIKYGVVCWRPETSYNSAVACFNSWLEDKDGVGDDENRQIIDQVKSFFELHGHSRFFDLDGYSDQKIVNMAGYKRVYKDEVTFFVSPSVFQKEICKNFNRKTVISLLIDQGFLLKDHNGDYRQQKWTPDGNKKVYVISGKILLG